MYKTEPPEGSKFFAVDDIPIAVTPPFGACRAFTPEERPFSLVTLENDGGVPVSREEFDRLRAAWMARKSSAVKEAD